MTSTPRKYNYEDPEAARVAGQNSKQHGMGAVRARGRAALDPTEVIRLEELRELLDTQPGRIEIRKELAARVALIVDRGYAFLDASGDQHYATGDGPLKYLGVYSNLLHRLLDTWPDPIEGAKDVTELMHGD